MVSCRPGPIRPAAPELGHETAGLRRQVRPARRRARGTRFLVPAVVLLAVTSIYPSLYSLYMSFFDWNWGQRFNFVGLDNYIDLLTGDRFRGALWNTIVFTVGAVTIEFVLGLGLALALSRLRFGQGLFRRCSSCR